MDGDGSISREARRGERQDAPASEAAERMRRAATAAAQGQVNRPELQAAARALVAELRTRKEPPEQVLLQIKQFLGDAGLRPGYPTQGDGALDAQSLYRDVISWSIRFYYEDGRPS